VHAIWSTVYRLPATQLIKRYWRVVRISHSASRSALSWINFFLRNRTTQCVSVDKTRVHYWPVAPPQGLGSVLGPVLFLVYCAEVIAIARWRGWFRRKLGSLSVLNAENKINPFWAAASGPIWSQSGTEWVWVVVRTLYLRESLFKHHRSKGHKPLICR